MMEKHCVYTYTDPRIQTDIELIGVKLDREPYYVGSGNPSRWLVKLHQGENLAVPGKTPSDKRTQEIVKAGQRPGATLLRFGISKEEATALEKLAESQMVMAKSIGTPDVTLENGIPLMTFANLVSSAQIAATGSGSASAVYQNARRLALRGEIDAVKGGNSWLIDESAVGSAISCLWEGADKTQINQLTERVKEAKRISVQSFSLIKGESDAE